MLILLLHLVFTIENLSQILIFVISELCCLQVTDVPLIFYIARMSLHLSMHKREMRTL